MRLFAFACAVLLLLAPSLAAQKTAKEAEQPEDPAAYRQFFSAGAQHKNLGAFVGTWKSNLRVWSPGSPPIERKMEQTRETRWILKGNFLQTDFVSKMLGIDQIQRGQIILGFNAPHDRYSGFLISDTGTRDMIFRGSYDEATKTFTYLSDERDPVRGDSFTRKDVYQFLDADRFRYDGYFIFQDKSEIKYAEGVFERVAAAEAAPKPGNPEKKDAPGNFE